MATQTWADGTTLTHDYSSAWQDTVTNERGKKKRYYNDAFARLVKVEEMDDAFGGYSTTTYSYDVLGNLLQVKDNANNTTSVTYSWLSRKTAMVDPDMGTWSYAYDSNGNLTSQTDAKSQAISFSYDALNRLTVKTYSTGMASVTYIYDNTENNSFGKGRRTGMVDSSGTVAWRYDNWGRVIEEKRTVEGTPYTTTFAWDAASRITSITYPTGEAATQGYNGRGLPYSLSSSLSGTIVASVAYNALALPTQIDLGNSTRTTYGYWDTGGGYDNPGGYFGKLWQIKTVKTSGSPATLQDMKHTWDAGGNLTIRENVKDIETESFGYDFLDRLRTASASGTYSYSESYTYATIGNMASKNGISYTYGSSKPHAVTAVGTATYAYDANGNMTTRGAASLTWDAENRLSGVTGSSTYVYDGDGFRVKKTEGGQTILYVNQYYEKNLTTTTVTLYYYLGGKMAAYKEGASLAYIHQDHLTGTSVTTDTSGNIQGIIKYKPFGEARSFTNPLPAQKFTGQRLDDVGLYYYGARYYDPNLARFISADTMVPGPYNPQSLNRYSYVLNNPLRYTDPTGHVVANPIPQPPPGIIPDPPPEPQPPPIYGPPMPPGFGQPQPAPPPGVGGGGGGGGGNISPVQPAPPVETKPTPAPPDPVVTRRWIDKCNSCVDGGQKIGTDDIFSDAKRALNILEGLAMIGGSLVLIRITVKYRPPSNPELAGPAIYAEANFLIEGINRAFGTDFPLLPPIFGPWRGSAGIAQ